MKGKVQVTREKEREKSEGEEGLRGRGALHLLYVGPTGPVDDDGDGSMLRPCSSLALYMGVISRSWHSILSWWVAWLADTLVGSRTGIR